MRWLWLPGLVLIVAGLFCSVSFFRYYGDAEYLEQRARAIERETGDPVRAAPQRSLAEQARTKNLLWGSGMGVGVVSGVALILFSLVGRRSSSQGATPESTTGERHPPATGANPEPSAAGSPIARPGAKLRKIGFYLIIPYLVTLGVTLLVQTLRGWEPFDKDLVPILIAVSIPIALSFPVGIVCLLLGAILWLVDSTNPWPTVLFLVGLVLLTAGAAVRLLFAQNYFEADQVPAFQVANVLGFILVGAAALCVTLAFRAAPADSPRPKRVFAAVLAVSVVILASAYSLIRYQSSQHDIGLMESRYERSHALRDASEWAFERRALDMDERKVEGAVGWVSSTRTVLLLEKIRKQRSEFEKQLNQLQRR